MPLEQRRSLRPFSVIVKPTGAACNLECAYCFFLSKEVLWGHKSQRMTLETLDGFVRSFLDGQPDGQVTLAWQGGEPTLRGLDFFREAVRLTELYRRPKQVVQQAIQTNGTLLDDEWGKFLAANDFLVGLSVDGPGELHDKYRVNNAGHGTYAQTRRGWQILQRHGVSTNILCAVSAANADHPIRVYRHLRDELGAKFVQFIPIVERFEDAHEAEAEAGYKNLSGDRVLYRQVGNRVTSRSVTPSQWGDFLTAVLDEWVTRDVGTVFVQQFDAMLGARFGRYSLCVHAPKCGDALVMEHNGEVYSCDHYVEPQYRLGNLSDTSFPELLALPKQLEFSRAKRTALPVKCQNCSVRWACNAGCPKDRFAATNTGEDGLNYLCDGYYNFFVTAWPVIEQLAQLIQSGRPPADIMRPSEKVD